MADDRTFDTQLSTESDSVAVEDFAVEKEPDTEQIDSTNPPSNPSDTSDADDTAKASYSNQEETKSTENEGKNSEEDKKEHESDQIGSTNPPSNPSDTSDADDTAEASYFNQEETKSTENDDKKLEGDTAKNPEDEKFKKIEPPIGGTVKSGTIFFDQNGNSNFIVLNSTELEKHQNKGGNLAAVNLSGVKVLEESKTWYHAKLSDKKGYVKKKAVTLLDNEWLYKKFQYDHATSVVKKEKQKDLDKTLKDKESDFIGKRKRKSEFFQTQREKSSLDYKIKRDERKLTQLKRKLTFRGLKQRSKDKVQEDGSFDFFRKEKLEDKLKDLINVLLKNIDRFNKLNEIINNQRKEFLSEEDLKEKEEYGLKLLDETPNKKKDHLVYEKIINDIIEKVTKGRIKESDEKQEQKDLLQEIENITPKTKDPVTDDETIKEKNELTPLSDDLAEEKTVEDKDDKEKQTEVSPIDIAKNKIERNYYSRKEGKSHFYKMSIQDTKAVFHYLLKAKELSLEEEVGLRLYLEEHFYNDEIHNQVFGYQGDLIDPGAFHKKFSRLTESPIDKFSSKIKQSRKAKMERWEKDLSRKDQKEERRKNRESHYRVYSKNRFIEFIARLEKQAKNRSDNKKQEDQVKKRIEKGPTKYDRKNKSRKVKELHKNKDKETTDFLLSPISNEQYIDTYHLYYLNRAGADTQKVKKLAGEYHKKYLYQKKEIETENGNETELITKKQISKELFLLEEFSEDEFYNFIVAPGRIFMNFPSHYFFKGIPRTPDQIEIKRLRTLYLGDDEKQKEGTIKKGKTKSSFTSRNINNTGEIPFDFLDLLMKQSHTLYLDAWKVQQDIKGMGEEEQKIALHQYYKNSIPAQKKYGLGSDLTEDELWAKAEGNPSNLLSKGIPPAYLSGNELAHPSQVYYDLLFTLSKGLLNTGLDYARWNSLKEILDMYPLISSSALKGLIQIVDKSVGKEANFLEEYSPFLFLTMFNLGEEGNILNKNQSFASGEGSFNRLKQITFRFNELKTGWMKPFYPQIGALYKESNLDLSRNMLAGGTPSPSVDFALGAKLAGKYSEDGDVKRGYDLSGHTWAQTFLPVNATEKEEDFSSLGYYNWLKQQQNYNFLNINTPSMEEGLGVDSYRDYMTGSPDDYMFNTGVGLSYKQQLSKSFSASMNYNFAGLNLTKENKHMAHGGEFSLDFNSTFGANSIKSSVGFRPSFVHGIEPNPDGSSLEQKGIGESQMFVSNIEFRNHLAKFSGSIETDLVQGFDESNLKFSIIFDDFRWINIDKGVFSIGVHYMREDSSNFFSTNMILNFDQLISGSSK